MSYMREQVEEAKKEMSDACGFDLCTDEKKYLNAGYLANMVNQIRAVIYDLRIEGSQYKNDQDISDCRSCTNCGRVCQNDAAARLSLG